MLEIHLTFFALKIPKENEALPTALQNNYGMQRCTIAVLYRHLPIQIH